VRSTQITPGGIRVCGTQPLTTEELAAVDALPELVRRAEEERRAALTPAELAAEDARHAEGAARLTRLQRHAREGR
jgi:hypothetical protein